MIGQNPKATQSDDLQDVVALLKDLPQVSAPANFNASLQARIAAAKAEASEFADVVSLVKELPRVKAPADFDFRLRARIAQAKSEQQTASAGWWAEVFGRTFSWAQAGAAMAAVAIVVSVVTFGVLRSGNEVKPANPDVAVHNPMPTASLPVPAARSLPPTENKADEPKPDANDEMTGTVKVKHKNGRVPTIKPLGTITPTPETPKMSEAEQPAIATRTVIIKHRSGEARVVNLSEYNLGLQTANLRATPKANSPKEQAFAANIF